MKMSPLKVERVMGIEPTWPAWKAGALPLSYTRSEQNGKATLADCKFQIADFREKNREGSRELRIDTAKSKSNSGFGFSVVPAIFRFRPNSEFGLPSVFGFRAFGSYRPSYNCHFPFCQQ